MKNTVINFIHFVISVLFRVFSIFIDDETIFFESFHGKQYSDNPRAIYEYISNQKTNFAMVWSVKKGYEGIFIEHSIPYVTRFSFKWILKMSRAKYWIVNTRLPLWMYKSKNTVYIQTWHGTPLKKLGLDIEQVMMPDTNTKTYKEKFVKESNRWDILISANSYSSLIFKRAFKYDNQILECGYPRNDKLVLYKNDHTVIKKVKSRLNLPKDKKIILYAPTWRDNQFYNVGEYKFTMPFSLKKFYDQFGEDMILLIRMHYLVSENLKLDKYENTIIDVSNYEDMNDLLIIADLLITDYSSSLFDYAILKRPVLLYMYDKSEYQNDIRGFYFDVTKELPNNIVETEIELFKQIYNFTIDKYKCSFDGKFHQNFCSAEDGNSSKRVFREIIEEKGKRK